MKKHKKIYVCLNKTRTEIGVVPTLGNNQVLNRDTKVFHAEKEGSSIFFIVREKDAIKLKQLGWEIKSILVKTGFFPISLNWTTGNTLETRQA